MAPGFWLRDGPASRLLAPLSPVFAAATARRVAEPRPAAPVPALCCGNVTIGGAGKTTVALDLAARLPGAHALTRGYGGRLAGPLRIDPAVHGAEDVGDEPLLLAAVCPTWVGRDRAATAHLAAAAGARVLVMDDGLQSPTLRPDLGLLVIDGTFGFGNGRVLPAGPLRESVAAGAARCGAAVLIGADRAGARAALPPGLPVLEADLVSGSVPAGRLLPFCGIAHPGKFFESLTRAGGTFSDTRAFPDHHRFRPGEIARLRAAAGDATLICTAKDYVRIPAADRHGIAVLEIRLAWRDEAALDALLRSYLSRAA